VTAVPLHQPGPDRVTLTHDTLIVHGLRVTHPETVALARAHLDEHGPETLPAAISTAIVVGMVASRLAREHGDVAGRMEAVLTGWRQDLERQGGDVLTRIDGVLSRLDEAERAASQAAHQALSHFPEQVEMALRGEAGTVRTAVREAASAVQQEALRQVDGVVRGHSAELRTLLSTENPAGPIAQLRRDLTQAVEVTRRELGDGLATVRATLEAQRVTRKRDSNALGSSWEAHIGSLIRDWATSTGDIAEPVGSTAAPGGTARTGDVLISVMSGAQPKIVIEAKNRARSMSVAQARAELATARRVRRAHAGVLIVQSPDQMPGGSGRWVRVDTHSWVVAAEDADLLGLVLSTVRQMLLAEGAAASNAANVDVGAAQTAVRSALDLLRRFDELAKHTHAASRSLGHLRETADNLRADLVAQLGEATRALQPSSRQGAEDR
jgi:hypothetical protein